MSIFNHSPYQVSISTSPYHQLNSDPESLACKHSIPAFPLHQQSLLDKDHHEPNHHDCAKHHTCHTVSLRQLILPGTMIALVALFGLLAWSCVNWHGWSNWEVDNLVRRGSPFVMPVWMAVVIGIFGVLLALGIGFWINDRYKCCHRGSK